MIFRVLFITLSSLALIGVGYAGYYGHGGESSDVSAQKRASVRIGSGGGYNAGGRVK
jgi:hypothetical protein